MPLAYLFFRVLRRLAPEGLTRWMLGHRFLVTPGSETVRPAHAADRYLTLLQDAGLQLEGKEVFVLGYGGFFGLGVELLRRGARHVVLCDPYAREDQRANLRLADHAAPFLRRAGDTVSADPRWLTVFQGSAAAYGETAQPKPDLVLSSSVCEHLRDPGETLVTLRGLTAKHGVQLHIVDVRDHFFPYPFEMYCHSERVWARYLDPRSHLNRVRPWQWEALFREQFLSVQLRVLESDEEGWRRARPRIRPEFLSGDEAMDSAVKIALWASSPNPGG